MYHSWEFSMHPTIICLGFMGGGWGEGVGEIDIKYLLYINVHSQRNFNTPCYYWGGWRGCRIGYKVFLVYKYICIVKILYTKLLFFLLLLILLCWGEVLEYWSIGYQVFVVYNCIFIEKYIYTQILFVFCVCFCCLVSFFHFVFGFFRRGW